MRTTLSLPAPVTAIAVTHSGPSRPVLGLPRPVSLMLLTDFPTPLICHPLFQLTRNGFSGDSNPALGISHRTARNSGSPPITPGAPLALTSPSASSSPGARHASTAASRRPAAAEPGKDRSAAWLRAAAAGLCALAAAAATVSFTAQYQLADATRHLPAIAALEAAIPDAAALVFACLGVALALHGRRAIRARTLNLASVGTSVFMNTIAAAPGWRNLAIWAMPPIAYALASDTLIGVIRALARHHHPATAHPGDTSTPLAIPGGLTLWLLRLTLAPASTLAGFRAWVLTECPVAPARRTPRPATPPTPPRPGRGPRTDPGKATKTARFLDLTAERHGPLAAIPLDRIARISADLAPHVHLNPGAARTALRKAVLTARTGDPR
jgi:Protein of unknown function (DUF2637)